MRCTERRFCSLSFIWLIMFASLAQAAPQDSHGDTAPELLSSTTPDVAIEKCKNKVPGAVTLAATIEPDGHPANVIFLKPLGNDFDKVALSTIASARFKAALHDGSPTAIRQAIEVDMQGCIVRSKDDKGKKVDTFRLSAKPAVKLIASLTDDGVAITPPNESSETTADLTRPRHVGGGVKAPVVLVSKEAEYSDEARRSRVQGTCVVSLIVDAQGMPQQVHIVRGLGSGLDEKALEAINRYRFRPAISKGHPVPTMISVEVSFKLY